MQYTEELIDILNYAEEEAMRTGSFEITADHILLGIIRHRDNCACRAFSKFGVAPQELKEHIDNLLFRHESISYNRRGELKSSRDAQNAINMSALEANLSGDIVIGTGHLFLALCKCPACKGINYLKEHGMDISGLRMSMEEEKTGGSPAVNVPEAAAESEAAGAEPIVTYFSSEGKLQS